MSLKKALVSGAAALALVGTAASAIQIEKDGTGDYLISPVYIANGAGWKTKIKVVNTNTTSAVIAKVIVREGTLSKELVDFPLFLTPGDVFEAELYEEGGKIYIKSDDDSVIVKSDGTPGIKVDLTANANILKGSGNYDCINEKMGYIEIIGLGDINESKLKEWDSNWTAPCPYPKDILFNHVKGATAADLNLVDAVDVSNSDLMGQQIIYRNVTDDNGKRAMFLNMLAFGDTGTAAASGIGVLGTDVNIETLFGASAALKDELAKSHVYVMYEGNDQYKADPFLTIFTYPYWKNSDIYDCNNTLQYTLDENTTIFRDLNETPAYCDPVPCDGNYTDTDGGEYLSGPTEEENKTTCPDHNYTKEVQIIFFHDPEGAGADAWANKYLFSSGGYIDLDLAANNDGTDNWKGLPIIPTTFYAKKVGDLYLNNHLYNQYLKERK